jgi:mRNA interferase RelE/StbE
LVYKIEFTPSAAKDYHSVQPLYLRPKIANALEEIALKPHQAGKSLKANLSGYYSYRISNYRIVYEIHEEDKMVLILRIRHRRDVYR